MQGHKKLSTGDIGDGKVFVYLVEEAVRICNEEISEGVL